MNPYLARRREQYAALQQSIEGVQNRAQQENRDLTPEELTSVRSQGAEAATLAQEITDLTEIETRNAAVAGLAGQVADDQQQQNRSGGQDGNGTRVGGGAQTRDRDRDPGHYRAGAGHSFFGDVVRARSHQDGDSLRRLEEHNRALDSPGAGAGVLPPVWMTSEFQELARQQRRAAAAVRQIGISDSRPISMPKQTADTGGVTVQTAENATTTWTSSYDTDVDTVPIRTVVGGEEMSRQLLDAANPAIDALVWGNLVAKYNEQAEAMVCTAIVASAGAPVKTYATNAAWTAALDPESADYVGDAILDAALAVRMARKLPASILLASVGRYGSLLKIKDTTGRPMIPSDSGGPMNVIGLGDVHTDGRVHELGVLTTDGIAGYPESLLAVRPQDVILFESGQVRFRYDEPKGPETIRLGVWGYIGTYVQHAGKSVKRIAITAAA